MRSIVVLTFLLVLALSSGSGWLAYAQQARTSSSIDLAHVTVQLSYPSTVRPGDSVMMSARATSKEDLVMDELVVQLYLPNGNRLQEISSASLAKGITMKAGSQVNADFNMTIPSGAPRGSLMAVVKENVRLMTSQYSFTCSNNVCYWVPNYTYPQGQNIPQVPQGFGSHDISFIPLTYVDGVSQVSSSANQMATTLKLDFVTVQLSYPSIVMPGQTVTLNAKTSSYDNFEMDSLDVQVYIAIQNTIKQIASGNVVRGVIMTTGSLVSRDINFTVPSDAPATSLLAVVTEEVRFPPNVNSFGYGYAVTVDQNSSYPYNYRISPVAGVSNPNVISYTALSYVNANVQPNANTHPQVQNETQPLQQNPNDLTAKQSQGNAQSQPMFNIEPVQLLAVILGVVALATGIAFLSFRRRTRRSNPVKQA